MLEHTELPGSCCHQPPAAMVSLSAKSFKYAAPPEHATHFPGVPVRAFTASAAATVYKANILKEKDMRAAANAHLEKLPEHRRERSWIEKISDTLPGLASINELCADLGYTFDHSTGRRIPPVWQAPPDGWEDLQTGQPQLQ